MKEGTSTFWLASWLQSGLAALKGDEGWLYWKPTADMEGCRQAAGVYAAGCAVVVLADVLLHHYYFSLCLNNLL